MTTSPGSRVVTFGEIMLRLASADGVRRGAAPTLDATFGGGEANAARFEQGTSMRQPAGLRVAPSQELQP